MRLEECPNPGVDGTMKSFERRWAGKSRRCRSSSKKDTGKTSGTSSSRRSPETFSLGKEVQGRLLPSFTLCPTVSIEFFDCIDTAVNRFDQGIRLDQADIFGPDASDGLVACVRLSGKEWDGGISGGLAVFRLCLRAKQESAAVLAYSERSCCITTY